MALFAITDNEILGLPEADFAAAGIKERADLQRLLRTNVQVIAPDVLVIAEEFGSWDKGSRRIDLLAVDKEAKVVVIELKRDAEGAHMELQALRYAAMVARMTFEQAVEAYRKFLAKIGSQLDPQASLVGFLGWSEANEQGFAQDVRIVLVAADFSQEITSTVLWLNDRNLDIRCVRVKPYQLEGKLLLDVQQVIPLPEAADYQIQIREKKQEERAAIYREKSDKPSSLTWDGHAENEQAVSSWKDVLVEGAKKMLALGLPLDALPMKRAADGANLISPREVQPGLHIETNYSSDDIIKWLSKMLQERKKAKGFLQIVTKSGRTIELPH